MLLLLITDIELLESLKIDCMTTSGATAATNSPLKEQITQKE